MTGHTKWSEIKRRTRERLRDDPAANQRYAEMYRSLPPVVPLAEVRDRFKRTQQDVAYSMGVSQARVSSIERADDLNVSTLDAYISSLGGRLTLLAEFGDEIFDLYLPAASEQGEVDILGRGQQQMSPVIDGVTARRRSSEQAG